MQYNTTQHNAIQYNTTQSAMHFTFLLIIDKTSINFFSCCFNCRSFFFSYLRSSKIISDPLKILFSSSLSELNLLILFLFFTIFFFFLLSFYILYDSQAHSSRRLWLLPFSSYWHSLTYTYNAFLDKLALFHEFTSLFNFQLTITFPPFSSA